MSELIANNIRKSINETFGINISIYFFDSKMVPRTTSGKISRQKCKKEYKNMSCLFKLI